MYKKIDASFSKEMVCAQVSSLNWRTNKTYCILVFVFYFHVYLVFDYSMELFAKVHFTL